MQKDETIEPLYERLVDRRGVRHDVSIPAIYRINVRTWWNVEVTNLSLDGFLATSVLEITPEQGALLLPEFDSLPAELRWSDGPRNGFYFLRPLHVAVLDHIVTKFPTLEIVQSDFDQLFPC